MIWIVMILTGLANFAVRFSMFSGLRASTLPDWAERYLRYVPTAVLSAIIAAALFLDEAGEIQMWNTTLLAGLIAAIIAILTRSVILTIITGLGVLWIIGSSRKDDTYSLLKSEYPSLICPRCAAVISWSVGNL